MPTGHDVAVRVVSPFGGDPAELDGLRRTAGLLTTRAHPHVSAVWAAGVTDAGAGYLVEEIRAGGSLRTKLEEGPLDVAATLALGVRLAAGMAAVHACGSLIGWVAPDSVRTDAWGQPTWCGVGVDLLLRDGDSRRVPSMYAAPEWFEGGGPTVATEVYGLGAVLAHALRGRALADIGQDEESIVQLMTRVRTGDVPDLATEGFPQPVAALIRTLTALDPADRPDPTDAGAMIRAVQAQLGQPVTEVGSWSPPPQAVAVGGKGPDRERLSVPPSPSPQPAPHAPAPRPIPRPSVAGWLVTDGGDHWPVAREVRIGTDTTVRPMGTGVVLENRDEGTLLASDGQPPHRVACPSATFLQEGDAVHIGGQRLRWRAFVEAPLHVPAPSHALTAAAACTGLYTEPYVGALLAAAKRCRTAVVAVDVGLRSAADLAPVPWVASGDRVGLDLPVGRARVVTAGPDGVAVPLEGRRVVAWDRVRELRYSVWGANQQEFAIVHADGRISWSPPLGWPSTGSGFLKAVAGIWRAAAPEVWRQARAAHTADLRQRHGLPDTGPADDAEHDELRRRILPPRVGGDSHLVT